MTPVRHVIFDLDGTLVDALPGIAFSVHEALQSCALPPLTRDLAPLIGPPIREILAAVSGTAHAGLLDRLENAFRASYDAEGWRRTVCLPGVSELLWGLMTHGTELWLATNKPAAPTSRILRELNLNGFFRETVCRDSRKPWFLSKGEMLIDLLSRHRLDPAECLMVGDTSEDWRAAEAAGMRCASVGSTATPVGPSGCRRIGSWNELEAMVRMEGVAA
jgi:phosphoglycolate phosphatase